MFHTRPTSKSLWAITILVLSYNLLNASDLDIDHIIFNAIQANQQILDSSYVEVAYSISIQQFGKIQREFYSSRNGFSKDVLASIPENDSFLRSTIKLRTFGSKYLFHKVDSDGQEKVIDNLKVIYNGLKTREIQYKLGKSVNEAFSETLPFLDVTSKKRGAHLMPAESPWGFLNENIGCRKGLVSLELEIIKKRKSNIQWLPSIREKKQVSINFEDTGTGKNQYIFDADQSFLPVSYTRISADGSVYGIVNTKYSKSETDRTILWYPVNIETETYWIKENAQKLLMKQTLKVDAVNFAQKPSEDVFNIDVR